MSAKFKLAAMSAVMMAGVLVAGAASAQMAVGGGATLPELLYDTILPSGIGKLNYSYTGTGSGAGKTAFITNDATVFRNESVSGTPAWGATQSVHFAGSDSALSTGDVSAYAPHASAWGPMIQIPMVATSVLIPYKRSGVTALNLSDAQMCKVFSKQPGGQTWGDILGNGDATKIDLVYRVETSGTQELLSRYLVAACPGSGFVVSNSFTTMVAGALPSGFPLPPTTTATLPPGDPRIAVWEPVTGSTGVSGAMGTDGRLGYLSPETGYTGSNNAVVSRINGLLPTSAAIQKTYAKQILPTSTASNPLNWVPPYTMPAAGTDYPIFGTTNLLINQCYTDAAVQANVVSILTRLTSTTWDADVAAHNFVVLPHGNQPAGTPAADNRDWKLAIANTFLNSSSPLSIGFPAVCNTRGRP